MLPTPAARLGLADWLPDDQGRSSNLTGTRRPECCLTTSTVWNVGQLGNQTAGS